MNHWKSNISAPPPAISQLQMPPKAAEHCGVSARRCAELASVEVGGKVGFPPVIQQLGQGP